MSANQFSELVKQEKAKIKTVEDKIKQAKIDLKTIKAEAKK